MDFLPLRVLYFLYGSAVIVFDIYCIFSHWNDSFWSPNVEDTLLFDFIIVGGGSAGSVVAARLAEDKGHSVLLLEAGGPPKLLFDTPSVAPLLHKTDYDWQYVTEPQINSCLALDKQEQDFCEPLGTENKTCFTSFQSSMWPRGKLLGGSGRLNFMMYVRGDPKDFNDWADHGNDGWSYEQVLPFFKKSETHSNIPNKYRGNKGPMNIEYLKWTSKLTDLFLEGGKALGYEVGDLNGELTAGFSVTQVTGKNGKRHSTDSAFLSKKRSNLKIITHAHTEKILFRNKQAFGVQFSHHGQRKFAFAAKEVVLSAGAVGSPQLLLLSGIGPKEHLQEHKISVIQDLPGVGSNLQDHLTAGANNVLLEGESSKMGVTLGQVLSPIAIWQYISANTGPVSTNGCEAYAMVYSSDTINRTAEPPDVQFLFFSTGHSFDGGKVIQRITGITNKMWDGYFAHFHEKLVASIFAVLLRPKSRGMIQLKSSNPYEFPAIDPQYLTHEDDIASLIKGLRKVEELIASQPFKSIGASFNKMPIPGCEHLKFGSDDYWACYVRHLSGTVYHPCCTCKMGPAADHQAVVDSKLRVRGIQGLRVIDASIMPKIIGANINAATIMIGEKGADFIRNFWALRASSCQWTDFFIPVTKCLIL